MSENIEKREISVTLNLKVTEENVVDILSTAFYGGISYWCPKVTRNNGDTQGMAGNHLWRGGELVFWEDEEETGKNLKPHTMTLDNLLEGIRMYIEGGYTYSRDILDFDGDVTLDCGMVDAEVADCIVQLAVFGELIYG